jgi:hypothetical protein
MRGSTDKRLQASGIKLAAHTRRIRLIAMLRSHDSLLLSLHVSRHTLHDLNHAAVLSPISKAYSSRLSARTAGNWRKASAS